MQFRIVLNHYHLWKERKKQTGTCITQQTSSDFFFLNWLLFFFELRFGFFQRIRYSLNNNVFSKLYIWIYIFIEKNICIFYRFSNVEEKDSAAKQVINIYQALETFLESDEYGMDLRKDLELSFPNYLLLLRKWRLDLEKNEHGIVIAGKIKIMTKIH